MKQLSLYRKYRPQKFSEICGQDLVVEVLKNSLKQGNISHSYLFSGERGTGKTSTARILAKALNCLNLQDGEPCNKCSNCLQINNESFLDVIEIDGASNNGVEQIRQLKDTVYYMPGQGKYKVYIIDEAHMITNQGFNAFLKTLEEPPPHVVFILATTEPEKILKTIHSRCTRFLFQRVEREVLEKHLIKIASLEGYTLEKNAAYQLSIAADGSVRDGLTLLQEVIYFASNKVITEDIIKNSLGFITKTEIETILFNLEKQDLASLFKIAEELSQRRISLVSVINGMLSHLEDAISLYVKKGEVEQLSFYLKVSDYLLQVSDRLKSVKNPGLFLKILFFELTALKNRASDFKVASPKEEDKQVRYENVKKEKVLNVDVDKLSGSQNLEVVSEQTENFSFSEKEFLFLKEKIRRESRLLAALLDEVSTFFYKSDDKIIVFEFKPYFNFHVRILKKYKERLEKIFYKLFSLEIELDFIMSEEALFTQKEKSEFKVEEERNLIEEAMELPVVQEILKLFPGSKITKVTLLKDKNSEGGKNNG